MTTIEPRRATDDKEPASRSRRSILAAVAAGTAALVAASLPEPESVDAATGDNLVLGQSNSAGAATALSTSGLDNIQSAFGVATSAGHAIDAATTASNAGAAIQARGPKGGVFGQANGAGAAGVAGSGAQGVLGYGGTGVAGFGGLTPPSTSPVDVGVYGEADTGVEGASATGIGVKGVSSNSSDPAGNPNNAGVVGVAGDTANVQANIALTGVYGTSDPSPVDGFVAAGVWGDSPDFGVIGTGGAGVLGDGVWGVLGATGAAAGIGIYATADAPTGRALRVEGRAEFTRSGRTLIAAGNASKVINLAGCSSSTLVFAVLASNRSGRWVRAVVPTTGKFTVYLNTAVASNTNVTWIAFTNPANHGG